ncbi:MAG: hypothetical protein ACRYFU_20990 [Janthinobacterium lividum]
MDVQAEPRIVAAEKMSNNLFIEFDDGRCALFPASLLLAVMPQANQVLLEENDPPEN